jgi:hypothetical protein
MHGSPALRVTIRTRLARTRQNFTTRNALHATLRQDGVPAITEVQPARLAQRSAPLATCPKSSYLIFITSSPTTASALPVWEHPFLRDLTGLSGATQHYLVFLNHEALQDERRYAVSPSQANSLSGSETKPFQNRSVQGLKQVSQDDGNRDLSKNRR